MQSNQKSPSWENIIKETIARGINPLSIIAYGYYGSQATGLATPSSGNTFKRRGHLHHHRCRYSQEGQDVHLRRKRH